MSISFYLVADSSSIPFGIRLLDPASYVVGRSPTCDILLHHPTVSRAHADIFVSHGFVTVVDLDSCNGTRVDSEPVRRERQVFADQSISFGSVALRLVEQANAWELESTAPMSRPRHDLNPRGPLSVASDVRARLSDAQFRVFRYLMAGLPEKRIATTLCLSPNTNHSHIRAIYDVMSVHSRPQLMAGFCQDKVPAYR